MLTAVSTEMLNQLAATEQGAAAKSESRQANHQHERRNGTATIGFDIERWIEDHHLELDGPSDWDGGRRWVFKMCPWNTDHVDKAAFIVQLQNGAIAAGCHHHSCTGKDWHALRDLIEPGWRYAKRKEPEPTKEDGDDPWDSPIPFHEVNVPEFPTEALPDVLRAWVRAVAEATQTPPDLAAMLALAVLAAACAKKVVVEMKEGYVEPVNLYTATALPPANRKSAVFAAAAKPLVDYERDKAIRMRAELASMESDRKIKEARLKKLQQDAVNAKSQEQAPIIDAASRLAQELAEIPAAVQPRLVADDCTPEKLSGLLCDQHGRIAVLSPEGDVFELMSGRYSKNGSSNFGVLLKAHAGDELRSDRVGRPAEFVKGPALTIGLAVQPEVIRGLIEKPGFRGRGLLGRFLYSIPESLLGRRNTNPQPVPDEVKKDYEDHIGALLNIPLRLDDHKETVFDTLVMEPDARGRMQQFESWLEPQLAEFGELGSIPDWAGKLVGAVGRIAGLLHMSTYALDAAPTKRAIPLDTVECAIRIGKYLIPHAKRAFAEMGADVAIEQAKHILRWIEQRGSRSFTKRDLHQALRGTFKRVEDLDAPLGRLQNHNYIRKRAEPERAGVGRSKNPTFDVNPLWSWRWDSAENQF